MINLLMTYDLWIYRFTDDFPIQSSVASSGLSHVWQEYEDSQPPKGVANYQVRLGQSGSIFRSFWGLL